MTAEEWRQLDPRRRTVESYRDAAGVYVCRLTRKWAAMSGMCRRKHTHEGRGATSQAAEIDALYKAEPRLRGGAVSTVMRSIEPVSEIDLRRRDRW